LKSGDATPGLELNALLWVWFYTHEQLLLDSKLKDILHKRKKAAHQTQHTQTEERNRDYSAHRGREKERKKERKWLGKQCCKEKRQSALF
jgi:hypothetical protein